MNRYMITAHITDPYCTGAPAWAGTQSVWSSRNAAAADNLAFNDVHRDRRDVEDLPAGAVHFVGAGEVGPAATATGFVADHDVRVGHLLQGLPAVSLLPAGHGEDSSRVLFP